MVAVEFAVVAIPMFLFIFASIEFGRVLMAVQSLEEAARAGCREAILGSATDRSVESEVSEAMKMAGIANHSVNITPVALTGAAQWAPVTVRVNASLNDMTWLPIPGFFGDQTFSGTCTLPREAANTN